VQDEYGFDSVEERLKLSRRDDVQDEDVAVKTGLAFGDTEILVGAEWKAMADVGCFEGFSILDKISVGRAVR
jgi:hypothetical protein